ncbi:hypothetical protein C481_00415 [Natrialba asiatica DSM 12278]|uniref:Uncharacterized protein n=1 Tax=Natrialba asiatica (strain ATCC 700177 / DSM 12278 / JCM 9576 / FERM P-10747 / NBRC 102637 / 172P1) TaxID=29540 RepID=M0B4X1_NATA1|nr:hypothetical protein C481_00415 [Natrialba asiatica DSM 12278]
MDVVGWMRPASQDFDAVGKITAVAFAFRERRGHLGAASVLDAHEGDTDRIV